METDRLPKDHMPFDRLAFEPETILVPKGSFLMGTTNAQIEDMAHRFDWARQWKEVGWFDNEQPQHRVHLSAYRIGRYPVTNAQYQAFVRATNHPSPSHWYGSRVPRGQDNHPVTCVDWDDTQAYCTWLRRRTRRDYRLPTEAQWEKAARGTRTCIWPWGDDWRPGRCNTRESGPNTTTPVGAFSPAGDSPYGCADMAGNVWEQTSDWYAPNYLNRSPAQEPAGHDTGDLCVLRSGPFFYGQGFARCACRLGNDPHVRDDRVGFRVVVAPVAS